MLDLSHITSESNADVQIFRPTYQGNIAGVGITHFQQWRKPRGCSMGYFFVLGAGGAGGSGYTAAAATAGGGGGGGASGLQIQAIIPLHLLPDTLYVMPGRGGRWVTGTSYVGGRSMVCLRIPGSMTVWPPTNEAYTLFNANGGNFGAVGTVSAGGAGGIAASFAGNATGMERLGATMYSVIGADAGRAGGFGSVTGTSVVNMPTTGLVTTGGAGGGGLNGAAAVGINGGTVNRGLGPQLIADPLPLSAPAATAAGNNAPPAQHPYFRRLMLGSGGQGGTGAGTTNANNGGNGGDGVLGGGGGGGGAGTNGNTGASLPGSGGDGIVIIISW